MDDQKLVYPVTMPDGTVKGGLTLREYYAGLVIQGMIASGEEVATTQRLHAHRNEKLVARAVEVTDALISRLHGGK